MSSRTSVAKATLFCPECPHESHVNGDWRRVTTDGGVRLLCPGCGTEILTRGEEWSPPPEGTGATPCR
jgi:hypothetical protein